MSARKSSRSCGGWVQPETIMWKTKKEKNMSEQNAIVISSSNFIAPVADITTALRRYQACKDFMVKVRVETVDYGKVPGENKPCLFKPGAEKMTAFFGFSVRFSL